MASITLSRFERVFTINARNRGAEYARAGAVTFRKRQTIEEPLYATVLGTIAYQVVLRYEDGILWATCTCPHFEETFDLCKHIWATLVECEAHGVAFAGRIDDIEAYDIEADDISADGFDDGFDDWHPGVRRSNVVPLYRDWSHPNRWRSQLSFLTHLGELVEAATPPEITWILDTASSGPDLSIEIATRARKKNGELGKPQSVRIAYSAVARISSPLDREILSIISAADAYGDVFSTRLSIGWPLAEYLLPKLVETGRLWIRFAKGEYQPDPVFDGGEPWQLSVRAEEREGKYVLVATLRRGGESVPLEDALAVTRGGFVIFRNAIARFADEGTTHAWAALLQRERIEVPAADLDDFMKYVAMLRASLHIDFPPGVASWQERRVAPRARIEFHHGGYDTIEGRPVFEYDGHPVDALEQTRAIHIGETKTIYVRDAAEEKRLLDALWGQSFRRFRDLVAIQPSHLPNAIARLIEAGWEVRSADGIYAGMGELELEVRGDIDWFDVNGSVTFGTEKVRLPRLLVALRKGAEIFRLDDGRIGIVRPEWREQLEPFIAAASDEQENGLRFRGNQVLLLDALLATRPEVSFDDVFERARRRILDVKITPEEPLDSFRGTLRPYQCEGLGWFSFLRDLGFGGCLADDMGLGKTVQVLALLDQRRRNGEAERRPSLVVAPRSLVFNWKAEAARFTPQLRLLDHSTPDRVRDAGQFANYDVVLTTYALLRKEAALFSGVELDYAILDEAQAIKNASSQAAKAATLLCARHRLALSGTPVENHLGELASLFEFLNPGMLRAKSGRVMKMLRHAGSRAPEAIDARTMLARAVRPFILRRTKGQVARELPDRVEQTLWCELEPKQRKLYDELRDYYRASILGRVATKGINRSKIHILEALLRMRQAACHPGLVDPKRAGETSAKLDALFEELPILLDGGHKVLVFSQFTSLLAIVRNEARQRGITHAYLDGASRDRAVQVARFQEDPSVPLFLISLKAGGLGLNLTAAEYVFLLDPWWNPAVEAQAIDRAHRIGQTRNVFAYRLVARDTIEEKILQLQQTKRDLADAIIGEENSILRQLTPDDLDLLLS